MKIAALQMVSTPDVDRNLDAARRLVADAARQGARLVALPEYFCLMGKEDDKLRLAESPGDGPIQQALSRMASEHGVWVIGGTLPLRCADPKRVLNACCVFDPQGRIATRYDKLHLFRFDNGKESYDEGAVLLAGEAPVTLDAQVDDKPLRVGLSICYDLRFPELYRAMMQPPCDLLCVPAAFTHTTGQAHWELLLRARAVENQCHVIAPAQGGRHENGRRTWGHSMVIDPWGEVLAVVPEGEGVALAELDFARTAAVRQQLPALRHRRF
jgi:predicted amidohydrolase